ncbi:MAG: hypothetical protein GXP10_09105 [Gammaproteobacteria bacterium]|nr:hypothetical protein [Gammaproteobacteria bacterium]
MRLKHRLLSQHVVLLLILLLPWAGAAGKGMVQSLFQAEFVLSDSVVPPPASASWRSVMLSDHWPAQRYALGRNGWYRLVVDIPDLPDELWGIYLRRFNMNAAIFLNGQFLGDGGSFEEPLSRNWNRPLYVTAPPSLWRVGQNVIHVRLNAYAVYGYLAPVSIGPAHILDAEYAWQNLLQIEISKALFPVMVAVGLFIFGLWFRRRRDVQYLWFSLAVLTWSLFSLNMFIKEQPFSTKTWEWIAHSSVDWWVIFLGIFIYRFIKQPRPWLERGYLLFGFSACLVYAWVGLETLSSATRWFHGGSLLIGFIVLFDLLNAARRERSRLYAKLAIGLALLLLLGINDWMFQFKVIGATGDIGLHLHHYFSPFVFMFMAWHLTGRFVTALNESERLNRELEGRVMEAQCEIEQHYQTIQEMDRQKAILQERGRLSREIHDGISGNVSNAIMMTELIRRETPELNSRRFEQLCAHLDDGLGEMRNLILTMEEDLSTVSELVSHVNDKYAQVLASLDISYQADISLLSSQRKLSPKESLNLLRILQEALNNIAKHAEASEVSLQAVEQATALHFEVCDNGIGFDVSAIRQGSYGLSNMRKRSSEVGGKLVITSAQNNGTKILLVLSLSPS